MGKKQYVVIKECGRKNIHYKVVFQIDVDKENARAFCLSYIKKQNLQFKFHIVETLYGVGNLRS